MPRVIKFEPESSKPKPAALQIQPIASVFYFDNGGQPFKVFGLWLGS
jgi:hypothetical protein